MVYTVVQRLKTKQNKWIVLASHGGTPLESQHSGSRGLRVQDQPVLQSEFYFKPELHSKTPSKNKQLK